MVTPDCWGAFIGKFSHEFSGAPDWNTNFKMLANGSSKRNGDWDLPHHKFTADYTMLSEDAKVELRQALYVTRGRLYSFRFIDPDDYDTDGPQVFGLGDGTSDPKQLIKTYTFGPVSYSRPIRLPLEAVVLADGEEIAVTIASLTGLATPSSPWPSGAELSWLGKFDVPVYFARDFNPIAMQGPNLQSTNVDLLEDVSRLVAVV